MPTMVWDTKVSVGQSIEGRLELTLDALDGGYEFWDLERLRRGAESDSVYSRQFAIGTFKYYAKALYSVAKAHRKGMLSPEQASKFAGVLRRTAEYEQLFKSHGVRLRYLEVPEAVRLRA